MPYETLSTRIIPDWLHKVSWGSLQQGVVLIASILIKSGSVMRVVLINNMVIRDIRVIGRALGFSDQNIMVVSYH